MMNNESIIIGMMNVSLQIILRIFWALQNTYELIFKLCEESMCYFFLFWYQGTNFQKLLEVRGEGASCNISLHKIVHAHPFFL